jgi:hypothetical protein
MALEDDTGMDMDGSMAGGPSGYYNPAFGLMAIQQPEAFVQHLASKGIPPPEDFPDDFTHQDAHQALGSALKDPSRMSQGEPTSFSDRFNAANGDAQSGLPGNTRAYFDPIQGEVNATDQPVPSKSQMLENSGKPDGPNMPLPKLPTRVQAPLVTTPSPKPLGAALKDANTEPWGGRPHVDPEPLPPGDSPSTAGGSAVPAGGTSEKTGDLNQQEPTPKNQSDKTKKTGKEDSGDAFGKALAGLSAMKPPTPIFPHPGNLPHPSNQISRSTMPTELLKELSHIGSPGNIVRLGALLKGR